MKNVPQLDAPFGLGTFAESDGATFPGLFVGGKVLDLSAEIPGIHTVLDLFEQWSDVVPRLKTIAERSDAPWLSAADLIPHPPLQPRQIFQAGANYRTHVIDLAVAHKDPTDSRSDDEVREETAALMDRRVEQNLPYVFIGVPSALSGAESDIVVPDWVTQADWELELAVVIGKPTYRVSIDEAMASVAAYAIANDITARDAVFRADMPGIGTDWQRSKNCPTFTPLGPVLVPAEFVDAAELRLTLDLNGKTMQDESTQDMIFGVPELISYISQATQLLPGDVLLTGSPAGNGMHWGRLLQTGDVITSSITGLGTQRNTVVA